MLKSDELCSWAATSEATDPSHNQHDQALPSVVSVCFRNGMMGAAFFEAESRLIRILEDIPEHDGTALISQCIQPNVDKHCKSVVICECSAKVLLMPARCPLGLVDKLEASHMDLEVVFRPAVEFKTEAGIKAISLYKAFNKPSPPDQTQCSVSMLIPMN